MKQAGQWLLATVFAGCGAAQPSPGEGVEAAMHSLEIQGHRGTRGTHPENTLAGFRAALLAGADVLELDVGWTRDEVVVVYHDESLNRDTTRLNGAYVETEKPLRDLTFDELSDYDVGRIRSGSRYSETFPDQAPVDGERIPTLREVLALGVRLNVEVKVSPGWTDEDVAGFVRQVLSDIRDEDASGRVSLQSFDPRVIVEARLHADLALPLSCLTSSEPICLSAGGQWTGPWAVGQPTSSLFERVRASGCQTWSPEFRGLTSSIVREAHAAGLRVVPWTVNEEEDLRRLVAAGVDGLITDYPAKAVSLLRRSGDGDV